MVELSKAPAVVVAPRDSLVSYDPARQDPSAANGRRTLLAEGGAPFGEHLKVRKGRRSTQTGSIPFVSVLHVDELGTIAWHEAEGYVPVTAGQFARGGDVIVSLLNPSKLRAAVIPLEYDVVECSAEFGVFEPRIDPYVVLGLLHHDDVVAQLRPLGRGTSSSRRRISTQDLLGIIAPRITSAGLGEYGKRVRALVRGIETARVDLAGLFAEK
jgi:hypothetical protein